MKFFDYIIERLWHKKQIAREVTAKEDNTMINKNVHDKKNEFQRHILNMQMESHKLDRQLTEALKTSKKVQKKLLTITEMTYKSQGGKVEVHNGNSNGNN